MADHTVVGSLVIEGIGDNLSFSGKVSYRNPKAVEAYLHQYPAINQFIEDAWPHVFKHFQYTPDLILEMIHYPEEGTQDELVGWIQSTDDVETGLDKMAQFEEAWYLDHMQDIDWRFNFNLETRWALIGENISILRNICRRMFRTIQMRKPVTVLL